MIQIRRGTFETNSSSTHSVTMCSKETFEKWKSGKVLFNVNTEKFIEVLTEKKKNDLREEAIRKYIEVYQKNDPYKIPWNELPETLKEKHIADYISLHQNDNNDYGCYSYEDYKLYYESGCAYTERSFTTEHGDVVCAFGKGGYSG